ncbi:hypothetical protein LAZ67_15000569 [Cordylochernes scorpioides]|uniref:Transposase n=1 Tax=Cordylochernes scorpioides TaxID=51811 RepID=A0ABY6L9A1_9ARAC|nr:hypothetical protein LAZ67_15000569 [Cordylochernes scorpioides]
MLGEFMQPKLVGKNLYFMQDGAPALYSNIVRTFLNEKFHHKWMGHRRPIDWPVRNLENALKIKSQFKENPRITIRELSEDFDISFGTCQTIIKNDLHLKRSPDKFVPHLLTNEQKENRKETCKNMV